MASLERRIQDLERLIEPSEAEDAGAAVRWALTIAVIDEYGHLKSCRATGYRGGAPVQVTDPVGDALGYPYTVGDVVTFAARRVLEPQGLGPDEVAAWTEAFREHYGEGWDEVEAEGPPEPARPWHGAF